MTTTALVRPNDAADPTRALAKFLEARQKNLAKFAASRVKPETLIRLAVFEFSQNEYLRNCTPESIYASLILASQIGLEPGGVKGQCYLVPFKGKCTLIPGWRGLVQLALRSKFVKSVYSHVVYEGDRFAVWLGSNPRVEHEPTLDGRGPIVAAYAVALMENGAIDIEVMPLSELEKVRETAARNRGGKDGPAYQDWEDQMYRKAPLRRLCKRLPLGDDFFLAAKADELAEAGEPEKITTYIDADSEVIETKESKFDSLQVKVAEQLAKSREQTQEK